MPRKKSKEPDKAKEFETFKLWKSLAPMLKLLNEAQLSTLGFDDPIIIHLLSIRTQKEFAKAYKVHETTLVKWNNQLYEDADWMGSRFNWMKKLTVNVRMALYRKAIVEGDAPRAKLWEQLVEGWQERSQVTNPAATEEMREANRILRQIAERK